MDKKEVAKIAIPCIAAFFVGDWAATKRHNHTVRVRANRKAKAAKETDVMKAIQEWYTNPLDNRLLGEVVDEWFYNNRFMKVMKQEF